MTVELERENRTFRKQLVITASPRARATVNSPLLRFVRDYADLLSKYEIHATNGTGLVISGTGLFTPNDLKLHNGGVNGGVAELAAIVARGECDAAILFLDPADPWSDSVENRALRRVCIRRKVRLLSTYSAAVQWANFEADINSIGNSVGDAVDWRPLNWSEGRSNVTASKQYEALPVEHRTLALIAHDEMKREMVDFVNANLDVITRHERIITTGTTGWLLKLIFASNSRQAEMLATIEARGEVARARIRKVCSDLLTDSNTKQRKNAALRNLLQAIRNELHLTTNDEFVQKVMPLPSGPEGGDVLLAVEVLFNRCHAIVFLHDPMSPHPHETDIRLLERTSQLPDIYAACVSDRLSAERWAEGVRTELSGNWQKESLSDRLRLKFGLVDVVLVNQESDVCSEPLGTALARACAGYLNQKLIDLVSDASIQEPSEQIRIGVTWGWGTRQVVLEAVAMETERLLRPPARSLMKSVIWSPAIGTIAQKVNNREAASTAQQLKQFFGGEASGSLGSAFDAGDVLLPSDTIIAVDDLLNANFVLATASCWNESNGLYQAAGENRDLLPSINSVAVACVSGVFLDSNGIEVSPKCKIVGMSLEQFRQIAAKGSVLLMSGGEDRRIALLAALRAGIASVLVTTSQTASWLLRQEFVPYAP